MNDYEKIVYLITTCCEDVDEVKQLLEWIHHEGIEHVYRRIHYMYDEVDCLKDMNVRKT